METMEYYPYQWVKCDHCKKTIIVGSMDWFPMSETTGAPLCYKCCHKKINRKLRK